MKDAINRLATWVILALAAVGIYALLALAFPLLARANHELPDARTVELRFICYTVEVATEIITMVDAKERATFIMAALSTGLCSDMGAWWPVLVHEVAGTEVWAGDGLDDEMVILNVFDRSGNSAYGWLIKKAYPWLDDLSLPGQSI